MTCLPDPCLAPCPCPQRHFLSGGPQRTRHTLPPLAFCALQTVRQVAAAEQAGSAPQVKRYSDSVEEGQCLA